MKNPQKVTKITTKILRQVNMLLNLVDSLTPMHNTKVKSKVMKKAHRSGYGLRKGTSIGRILLKAVAMDLFIKLSMYPE